MASVEFDILLSSDLQRAFHTAQYLADGCDHPVVVEPGLRERHFGIFQGLTWDEIQQAYPDQHAAYWQGPDCAPSGGESARQFHARILACVSSLVTRYTGQRLVLVTHGGVLSVLFKYTVGLDCQAARHFALPNASLNTFTVTAGQWKLEQWGDTDHCRHAVQCSAVSADTSAANGKRGSER